MEEDNKLGFFGSLGNTINNNPLGFGMSLLNAGLGAYTGIANQQRQVRQANQNIDFQNQQRMQSFRDADSARVMRNQFRNETRQAQIGIAQNFLLPGIERNANLAFESQLFQNVELDRQMAFQRQNIMRAVMEQRGSIGASGEGRGRSFERAAQLAAAPAGRQMGQLDENRVGADARTRLANKKTSQDAYNAAVNIMAPFQLPVYQESAMSQPLMQQRISAPANSGLMIGAGSFLGQLGGFFNKTA